MIGQPGRSNNRDPKPVIAGSDSGLIAVYIVVQSIWLPSFPTPGVGLDRATKL